MSHFDRRTFLASSAVVATSSNFAASSSPPPAAKEDWLQYKFDSQHSGNVESRSILGPLKLSAAVPLSDSIFTSPVVKEGVVYAVDGAGVAWSIDLATAKVNWKRPTSTSPYNCNNISSPIIVGDYLHFGTMTGDYLVLALKDGSIVARFAAGDPIFSTPVIAPDGACFATLGSRIYGVTPEGRIRWKWDFIHNHMKLKLDRWSGQAWAAAKGRVTWRDQFACSRNIAMHNDLLVVPSGGWLVILRDAKDRPDLKTVYYQPKREAPSTLGLSMDVSGTIYRQWYRRDNYGRVEILKFDGETKVSQSAVPGTTSWWSGPRSMSFSSVTVRGKHVFRTAPEDRYGLCRHELGNKTYYRLCASSATAPPVLIEDQVVYGSLDGNVHIVPAFKQGQIHTFKTPRNAPITAPVAVADNHVIVSSEDGYVYILGSKEKTSPKTLPSLNLHKPRAKFTGKFKAAKFNWYTNFGNQTNSNIALGQADAIKPPFKMQWIRRFEGTVKHMSVFGGGRMYTHTAEGQVFAVEQETGRLLWRRHFPGVHVSYTAPVYMNGKLLVPQAGIKSSAVRCLDAATGRLLWQAPFTGSPSWNRQIPPIVHNGLAIYQFSTGKYGPEKWLFEHQNTFSFPANHKPIVRAWDVNTGKERWSLDFSKYGSGGDDAGLCLIDGILYYSCYFGRKKPPGITAAINPDTGKVIWKNTQYAVHAGCTVSGADGRLYLGGYNAVEGKKNFVYCLSAKDGSLIWKSDPIDRAIHVITIGKDVLFTHAQYRQSYLLEKATGKVVSKLNKGYRCTRFTMCGNYLIGANLDTYDTANGNKLISSGPAIDVLLCVGAQVSNGRIYYTTNGAGLQTALGCGDEAKKLKYPWE